MGEEKIDFGQIHAAAGRIARLADEMAEIWSSQPNIVNEYLGLYYAGHPVTCGVAKSMRALQADLELEDPRFGLERFLRENGFEWTELPPALVDGAEEPFCEVEWSYNDIADAYREAFGAELDLSDPKAAEYARGVAERAADAMQDRMTERGWDILYSTVESLGTVSGEDGRTARPSRDYTLSSAAQEARAVYAPSKSTETHRENDER